MTRTRSTYLALLAVLLSPIASATLIQFEAQGTVDDCFSFSCDLIPFATVVSGIVEFDVSNSAPSRPILSSVTGAFTWNDGTPQSFNVTGGSWFSLGASGQVGLRFTGPGLTFGTYTLDALRVTFNVGTNVFSSTDPWGSLFPGASISYLGLQGTDTAGGGQFGCSVCIGSNVSGSVSVASVPEPGTLALLGLGLLGMGAARRRKKA